PTSTKRQPPYGRLKVAAPDLLLACHGLVGFDRVANDQHVAGGGRDDIAKLGPLDEPIKKPKATWVKPVVRAEVTYGGVTEDGLLREPVFKGLRDDLLLPGAPVPMKDELAAYWTRVAKKALKYLGRRPLKLVRHVHDATFYHKGPLPEIPPAVHRLTVQKR